MEKAGIDHHLQIQLVLGVGAQKLDGKRHVDELCPQDLSDAQVGL
jgi:hypothetical protein